MHRRQFLQRAALLGGAAALGGPQLAAGALERSHRSGKPPAGRFESMLEHPASESPIDTVVVVMMENRSFDHYLGWLADDERYLERGKSRYGGRFRVDGKPRQSFTAPDGTRAKTASLVTQPGQTNPFRGCDHYDPGHGWVSGRAQRDGGFLAEGSGNDLFALGYYTDESLPFFARLARQFTVADRWHSSVLSSTYPNRNYLHAAQSGNAKTNAFPIATGGYPWPTIWDRLGEAGVDAGYYFTDLPFLGLYGERLVSFQRPIEQYFTDAEAGTLPHVTFLDPSFIGETRTDDHPHADIRAGQRFLRDLFSAFSASEQWRRGAFVVTYDEWGGFFDHVAPPVVPDSQRSPDDLENWGQTGFRVPALIASPFARRGFADHTLYDHTSVLRFLEWRFLGAPAKGPGKTNATWFLTERDRNANNLGGVLANRRISNEVGFDLDFAIDAPSEPCVNPEPKPPPGPPSTTPPPLRSAVSYAPGADSEGHPLEQALHAGWFERFGYRIETSELARTWVGGGSVVHH